MEVCLAVNYSSFGIQQKHLVRIVCRQYDTETSGSQILDYAQNSELVAIVEVGGRFVHQNQAGLLGNGAGN